MYHILIVDPARHTRTKLVRLLKSNGYRATGIDSADALPLSLAINKPDVVLLDVSLDGIDYGMETCRALRNWSTVPIIIVAVNCDERTKIEALDAGADDVLITPFSFDELLARVRVIQRRMEQLIHVINPTLTIGDLVIDLASSHVTLHNEPIHLTRNEFKLLKTLVNADGKPVTYKMLLGSVYGREGENTGQNATIRGLIQQLRGKLNDDVRNPRYILTESRLGYRFNMNPLTIFSAPTSSDDEEELGNQRTV